jgi:GAF domain-containing protein
MNALQRTAEELLFATGGSRVTIHLDLPDENFPVVAEAVTHGARHIKGDTVIGDLVRAATIHHLEQTQEIFVQTDLRRADPPVPDELIDLYGAHAQMLAPVICAERLAAIVSVHYVPGPLEWTNEQIEALRQGQGDVLQILGDHASRQLDTSARDLRDAGIQGILDNLRRALAVHRCTLRQNVLDAYAYPVTYESRAEEVNPLLGDFTIVQTGQPVVEKLLRGRSQVVQNDSRNASSDLQFQTMLNHYGGMRAQIVTPLFHENSLIAILSVHQLHATREWSTAETELARNALELIGRLLAAATPDQAGAIH